MEVNVSQLLQSPIGTVRSYEVSEVVDVFGDGNGCPVQGEVRLLRTNRSILVEGTLSVAVELACSRCLSSFRCPLSLHIEDEYVPTIDVVSGLPLPVPDEPGTFTIDEHHIIDLTEAIRQYAVLAVPMKPLCREDCAGLCQTCGKNLNQGTCDCLQRETDPRWSELMKLLK